MYFSILFYNLIKIYCKKYYVVLLFSIYYLILLLLNIKKYIG